MKLYKIRNWGDLFENNRSRTVKDLAWVAIPNRHDGENFSSIMLHPQGAEIFSAWILMLQVASRCQPRGSLLRDAGKPHTARTLSVKTRAPEKWFALAFDYLIAETDWLDYEDVASDCQPPVRQVTVPCQAGDEEGKGRELKGTEGEEGSASPPPAPEVVASAKPKPAEPQELIQQPPSPPSTLLPAVQEFVAVWNTLAGLPRCLNLSDARRRKIETRLRDAFFSANWREAMPKVQASQFCQGVNDRGWRADIDWFLQPDTCAKIIEGKYQNTTTKPTRPHPNDFIIPPGTTRAPRPSQEQILAARAARIAEMERLSAAQNQVPAEPPPNPQ